jgi:hypothetical protein
LKPLFLIASIVCFGYIANAQQFKNNVGAPYMGLSAYSTVQNNVFGAYTNVATLGTLSQSSIGTFAERRFGLQDINNATLLAAIATKSGGIGIEANRYGFAGFSETQVGVGYGRNINNKISIGGKVNYYTQQIPSYGKANVVNIEAGMLLQLTPRLKSGVSMFNPIASKFGIDNSEKLASIYKLGIGYDVSNKVFIGGEFVKQENTPLNFVGMVHYQFEKMFYAKVGVSTAAANVFAAAGVSLSNQFKIEIFTSHHQQLGFSPGLMLLLNLAPKAAK